MTATVGDIIEMVEALAPVHLAEDWDNVGLQVGRRDWPVKRVWTALDPAPAVIAAACAADVQLLITHHPLLFRPLSSVDFQAAPGDLIYAAARHHLSVYAAHTNLDSARGGLNDVVAERIGLADLEPMAAAALPEEYKLAVFVPADFEDDFRHALLESGAGQIGDYRRCTFRTRGKGTFEPAETAAPVRGEVGRLNETDEVRFETVVRKDRLASVLAFLQQRHPYETMAYDLYPVRRPESDEGIGRIGRLETPQTLADFARRVKSRLKMAEVKLAGDPELVIRKAAVCTGSGSGLMKRFLASDAQAYVSGDLKYHDARNAEWAGRALIDVGHFACERLIVDHLAQRLAERVAAAGLDVAIEACNLEREPFVRL